MKTEISEGKQTSHVTQLVKLRRINHEYFNGLFMVTTREVLGTGYDSYHLSIEGFSHVHGEARAINSAIYALLFVVYLATLTVRVSQGILPVEL
jgi:hypothetical protein